MIKILHTPVIHKIKTPYNTSYVGGIYTIDDKDNSMLSRRIFCSGSVTAIFSRCHHSREEGHFLSITSDSNMQ